MTAPDTGTGGLLRWLGRQNRTTVFLATLALVLAALFAPPPVGGVLLLALTAGLAALLAVTWPVTAPATRALRLAVLVLLVVAGLGRLG
ncbi:MAG TPA: DUF6703 family protein [Micromonosporaceae bacterium]|nr:DUF6703 family protein [Micromonosporaceae bacterium]